MFVNCPAKLINEIQLCPLCFSWRSFDVAEGI